VSDPKAAKTDVVLVGAGIMSATVGALLRQVEPGWSISLVERLDGAAAESSDLIGQLRLSASDRARALREFAPSEVDSDWNLDVAGQRVQVIPRAKGKGGVLDFGTTVLSGADGSIAGLLGASPGASTAVPAMIDVMERCFSDRYRAWLPKIKEMVPSLGTELSSEPALFEELWSWGTKVLKLDQPVGEHVTVAAE
jgi:malate dehydrogenase (quinone)